MAKVFNLSAHKRCVIWLPFQPLNRNVWTVNTIYIKRVCLAASAVGSCCSRLHYQGRVSLDLVTLSAVRSVANMQVPGQEYVRAAACQSFHRHARASDQVAFIVTFGKIKWMMSNYNLDDFRIKSTKPVAHPINLLLVYSPALNRKRARCVDSQDCDLFIVMYRS